MWLVQKWHIFKIKMSLFSLLHLLQVFKSMQNYLHLDNQQNVNGIKHKKLFTPLYRTLSADSVVSLYTLFKCLFAYFQNKMKS